MSLKPPLLLAFIWISALSLPAYLQLNTLQLQQKTASTKLASPGHFEHKKLSTTETLKSPKPPEGYASSLHLQTTPNPALSLVQWQLQRSVASEALSSTVTALPTPDLPETQGWVPTQLRLASTPESTTVQLDLARVATH